MVNSIEGGEVVEPSSELVAILDAGAQYGKVIDRRIRSLCVKSEILPMDTSAEELGKYKAIIISGGPNSVYSPTAPDYDPRIFSLGKPILGICYGMQLINQVMGGRVGKKERREDGPCNIIVDSSSVLFEGLEPNQEVLMSHGDSILRLAPGFKTVADSNGIVAAIENTQKKLYGTQFHPEVDLTVHGKDILRKFLFEIAGFSGNFTMEDREQRAIDYIKEIIGEREVLVLVSGGVDSTVCAVLLVKALGSERVHAIHVDNGFMRYGESIKVAKALEVAGVHLSSVNASSAFYNATTVINGLVTLPLGEVVDPETKRKIIGDTFMNVAEEAIANLGLDPGRVVLAQGTLRPDLIESASKIASGKADSIKTHHNDTAAVRKLREEGKIVEPLRDYHKDEVRELGKSLGLPDEIVWRQPFPGPGLAIRIICAEKPYMEEDFDEIRGYLQTLSTEKMSVTLLPIKTVGVQGDGRSYSYLVGLSGEMNWEELFKMARRIPKEVRKVNRVVYIFGKPIEGEIRKITQTHLTSDVISQLQLADEIVNQELLKNGLVRTLSQVPVISFPIDFDGQGKRSIGIRTFITNDFMTGVPAIPGRDVPEEVLETMIQRILGEVPGISRVVYDLTSKPPGTTEWE